MTEEGAVSCGSVRALKMDFITLLFIIISLSACSAQVPVVLWSSEGHSLSALSAPAAGEIVSGGKLASYLKSALKTSPHTVVLFLQDQLSIDDFTVYGGVFGNKQDSVFKNVEAALEASSHLVVPAVAWSAAGSVQELFQEVLGVAGLHVDSAELAQLQLSSSQPSLLVLSLPYASGPESKEFLRKNDETIGDALTLLKAQKVPYTAVYTGLRPSHVTEEAHMAEGFGGRSLLQTPEPAVKEPVMFNSTGGPCILFWADALNVSFEKGAFFDLAPLTFNKSVTLDGSFCNESTSRLVFNYKDVMGYPTFQLIFSMSKIFFPVSARNWMVMEHVELNYNGQRALFNASRGVYTPAEYSFHCQRVSSVESPLLVPNSTLDNATKWTIMFTNFQIQSFNVTQNFAYASDCASFFTPGIWMGLLTTLLMLLILTYGLHMIMQVRTMDRFDDPKGPAISVPQNE
ncbi:V-type proton ATPase subunit S1b isoform X1 [Astyanax mexicanus]|uniref:V-type proton ATPase subunit S1b isoform X1 n=1 Tax=Astyanax mexicanus TaxID=7994 RepID=UPI0020CAFFAD|nr:V-type proton ATPase subunit S1b isoform X1 [Astyanax mexicanus]